MATAASGEELCGCLRKILVSLEKGDPVEAAIVVPAMNAVVRALPAEILERDAKEAVQLLARCAELEGSLRKGILESMRQLGAARKSVAYRIVTSRP